MMVPCYNRGCGQKFDPEQNRADSCCHHPGAPFFHDAYKGWSCCNKKSVDFTEFLSIKGCTLSQHSNVKPPDAEKPSKDTNDVAMDETIIERTPIREAMERPSIETPMMVVKATVSPALKEFIATHKVKLPTKCLDNPLDKGEVTVGTTCKNSGCTYSYGGTANDFSECQYHSGVPIFHEGMKYWSCCQRKTSDFSVFMAQKGCIFGQHKYFNENDDKKIVNCRYDWHQTSSNVIVSIYAKMYDYGESTIEINPIRLHVSLVFPEQGNAKFDVDLELRGIIVVNQTTANMYGTKVEITMPKAEPGLWSKLDFPNLKQLPPAQKKACDEKTLDLRHGSDAEEDDFNLDDIETVNTGFRLAEISANDSKNDID